MSETMSSTYKTRCLIQKGSPLPSCTSCIKIEQSREGTQQECCGIHSSSYPSAALRLVRIQSGKHSDEVLYLCHFKEKQISTTWYNAVSIYIYATCRLSLKYCLRLHPPGWRCHSGPGCGVGFDLNTSSSISKQCQSVMRKRTHNHMCVLHARHSIILSSMISAARYKRTFLVEGSQQIAQVPETVHMVCGGGEEVL